MKALLALAIGLVMVASATIVMGVAVAEEDVQIEDVLLVDEPVVTDEGDGLVIAPAPGTDDGSTDTDEEGIISTGICLVDPQEPGEYYHEWVDGDGNIWRTDYFVNEDGTTYETGIPYRVDENGNFISNYPPDEGYIDLSEMQLPEPLLDPSWSFDDISLPVCPDMFGDMDNIFSGLDTPLFEKLKYPLLQTENDPGFYMNDPWLYIDKFWVHGDDEGQVVTDDEPIDLSGPLAWEIDEPIDIALG